MKKILVVDDETEICTLVQKCLEKTGQYSVMTTSVPEDAVRICAQEAPDLVLLDIVMPNKEGPDIVSEMRKDATLKNIPIVFLTATVTQQEVADGNGKISGYPFVAKPGGLNLLMDAIDKNLAPV